MSHIDFLLTENRLTIFSHLDKNSILQCRRVSKKWYIEASANYIWANFLENEERAKFQNLKSFESKCFEFFKSKCNLKWLKSTDPLSLTFYTLFNCEKAEKVVKGTGVFFFFSKKSVIKYSLADQSSKKMEFSDSLKVIWHSDKKFVTNAQNNLVFSTGRQLIELCEDVNYLSCKIIYEHTAVITDIAASSSNEAYLVSSQSVFNKKSKYELTLLRMTSDGAWQVLLCKTKWEKIEDIKLSSEHFFVISERDIATYDMKISGNGNRFSRICEVYAAADCSCIKAIEFDQGHVFNASFWTHIYFTERPQSTLLINQDGLLRHFPSLLLHGRQKHELKTKVRDIAYLANDLFVLGKIGKKFSLTFANLPLCTMTKTFNLSISSPVGITFFENEIYLSEHNQIFKGVFAKKEPMVTSSRLMKFLF